MLTLRGVPGSWVHVGFAGPGGIPGAAAPHLLPEACFPLLLCPLDSRQEEELQGNRVRPDEPGWPLVVWGRRRPWEKRGVSPPQRLPLTPVLYSRDRARLEGNLGSHWTKKVEQVVSSWTAGGREETGPRQREKPGGSTAYGDRGVQRETGAGTGHSGQVHTHFSSCEALRKSSWRVLSMAGGWSGGWHETVVCVKAPWPGEQLPGSWVLSAPGCALGGGKCFWFPAVISSEWGPRGGWRPLPSSSPPCSCRISPALSLCTAGLRT